MVKSYAVVYGGKGELYFMVVNTYPCVEMWGKIHEYRQKEVIERV